MCKTTKKENDINYNHETRALGYTLKEDDWQIQMFHCMSQAYMLIIHNYSARSWASAEYWKHFTARFDGVHAFGYNSAESEPISMKSGALGVDCLWLASADFGRDPRSSESG